MQTQPEFLHGSISQDFQEILDGASSPEAASLELAGKKKPKPHKSAPPCATEPSTTPTCTKDDKDPCKKKKKAAFVPDVQGWSAPPTPPAF
jgi:hypothetical protein